jgi:hypothetical protein
MVKQCGLGGFRRGATAEPFRAYALKKTNIIHHLSKPTNSWSG